jgi:hypothetical protein
MPAAAAARQRDPAGIPAYWRRRAAELRHRLEAPTEAWFKATAELTAPFTGRNETSQSRARLLAKLEAGWRAQPAFGRLALHISRQPAGFVIVEARAFGWRTEHEGWSGEESSIGILLRYVRIDRKTLRGSDATAILGAVNAHAIGRRYQRGSGAADRLVLADLLPLAQRDRWEPVAPRGDRLEAEPELDILVPSGGGWRAAIRALDGRPALDVRTFRGVGM